MSELRKRREGEEKTPDSAESDHVSLDLIFVYNFTYHNRLHENVILMKILSDEK